MIAARAAVLALALALVGCAARVDPHHLENQLEREVQALSQIARDLRYQAETCEEGGPATGLYADLHQVFSGSEATVERQGPITVVILPLDVLFNDPETMRFREEATMQLDLLATALKLHPSHRIELAGHTDDGMLPAGGPWSTHFDRAYANAMAVMDLLTGDFGVDPGRFRVTSHGQWSPIASNDVPSGQRQNRRVEVRIRPHFSLPVDH